MIRIIITLILILHGIFHLPGFVHAFGLAKIDQIKGETLFTLSKTGQSIAGLMWLVTSILLVISALLLLFRVEAWWMLGLPALVISQVLIVIYWHDAKYGTIVNIILLLALILAISVWQFKNKVEQERQVLFKDVSGKQQLVSGQIPEDLPFPVQKWLQRANIAGKNRIQSVHLHQKGTMRTSRDGQWMPVNAEQYFSVNPPGFLWVANVKAATFLHLAGMDKYHDGRGHMQIKLLSLIPVVDARGEQIDQGALVRYLAEIIWFPSAALSHYITWEALDAQTAKATIGNGGISASGVFRFNGQGDVISFEAQRYYDRQDGATMGTWFIDVDENSYKTFDGLRIPARSSVTWKLEDGAFKWYVLEITGVTYGEQG